MPARKQPHEFTACEQFGTRYSALGKRIEASVPKGETAVTRTYSSELDIFQLCDSLAVELEDSEAELEYIAQNRKQYYQNHSYMNDKAIGTAYDGPVFPDDIIYRRSSGEKYTVQADGSITTAAGRTYKAPDFQNFIHTFPKKGAAKKEAAPVLTLPKQDNPLVEGECKTRTPEEASRSAAKQREQARKEAAKTTEEEKQTVREHYLAELTDKEIVAEAARRGICPIEAGLQGATALELIEELRRRGCDETFTKTLENAIVKEHCGPKAVAEILPDLTDDDLLIELDRRGVSRLALADNEDLYEEINRRGLIIHLTLERASHLELTEECKKRGIFPVLADFSDLELAKEMESRDGLFHRLIPAALQGATDQELREEINRRMDSPHLITRRTAPIKVLNTFDDKDLAEELRRRGYTVTATKTVEI